MRRRAGALLVAVLVAAACGGGDDDQRAGADGTSTTLAPGAAAAPAVTAPAGVGPGAAPAPVPGATSRPGVAAPPVGTVPPAPAAGGAAIAVQPVGRLAPFLLRPGHGDRIAVEVRAQAGAEPRAATLAHVTRVLTDASGKEVLIDGPDPVGGAGEAWTAASLGALADRQAELAQGGSQVVLRLLFLRGSFEGDRSVLGVAVRGDVAAVFSDQVDGAAGLLVDPGVVEDAVTVHEVGHLLGLVDLVVGSGRGDPEHPGHSRNQRSVMYWAVESDAISQLLGGGVPNELDGDDRAELATIRRG